MCKWVRYLYCWADTHDIHTVLTEDCWETAEFNSSHSVTCNETDDPEVFHQMLIWAHFTLTSHVSDRFDFELPWNQCKSHPITVHAVLHCTQARSLPHTHAFDIVMRAMHSPQTAQQIVTLAENLILGGKLRTILIQEPFISMSNIVQSQN